MTKKDMFGNCHELIAYFYEFIVLFDK